MKFVAYLIRAVVFSFALKWIEMHKNKTPHPASQVFSFALKWIEMLAVGTQCNGRCVFSFALKWIEMSYYNEDYIEVATSSASR